MFELYFFSVILYQNFLLFWSKKPILWKWIDCIFYLNWINSLKAYLFPISPVLEKESIPLLESWLRKKAMSVGTLAITKTRKSYFSRLRKNTA